MALEFRLPFRRRRSRWERLRDTFMTRDEVQRLLHDARRLGHDLPDAARLREALPDPSELAQRAQPLLRQVATAGQGGAERLSSTLGRRRPSASERILNAGVPVWLMLGIGIGAFLIGFGVGQGVAASQRRMVRPEALEAAAAQIKERWPSVVDDDIREAHGDLKRLSSVIGERTGESARSVRERLTAMTAGQSSNGHS
jgi:uncharacterized protein YjbJ (UPF0337 family)